MIYDYFTGQDFTAAQRERAQEDVKVLFEGALRLEYGPRLQASGCTRDCGHSFSHYGPTKAGK